MSFTDVTSLAGRAGLDVLALMVLLGVLYRRRLAAPEMALVFTALNIGLFAAVSAIGTGDFPTGVGFGLFGLLSLVRLRSAAFTLKDVAYTFAALVIALVTALPGRNPGVVVALVALVLTALWVTDASRSTPPSRVMRVTLDRALGDVEEVRAALRGRLPSEPLSVAIEEVDWVRDTTRVSVRHEVTDRWQLSEEARSPAERAALEEDVRDRG